jgi:hypothetical protein
MNLTSLPTAPFNDDEQSLTPRRLDHQITVRLNREDWLRLQRYSDRRGLRLPQLLRACALERVLAEEASETGAQHYS